jgi:hypothetical protein
VVTHYLSHGEGYGVISPALAGVMASAAAFGLVRVARGAGKI